MLQNLNLLHTSTTAFFIANQKMFPFLFLSGWVSANWTPTERVVFQSLTILTHSGSLLISDLCVNFFTSVHTHYLFWQLDISLWFIAVRLESINHTLTSVITRGKINHFRLNVDVFNIICKCSTLIAVTVVMLFSILPSNFFLSDDKLTQIPEKHRMITQSSDPAALSKITDGLHTSVKPATMKQDSRMFFPSSVHIS